MNFNIYIPGDATIIESISHCHTKAEATSYANTRYSSPVVVRDEAETRAFAAECAAIKMSGVAAPAVTINVAPSDAVVGEPAQEFIKVVSAGAAFELRIEGRSAPIVAAVYNGDDAQRLAACWDAFEGVDTRKIEGKSIVEYVCNEAYLKGMNPVDGSLEIGLSGLACQMLAESFAGQFEGSGAVNFLEVNMEHDTLGPFTVTIQRAQGMTPGALRARALTELRAAEAVLAQIEELTSKAGDVHADPAAVLKSIAVMIADYRLATG